MSVCFMEHLSITKGQDKLWGCVDFPQYSFSCALQVVVCFLQVLFLLYLHVDTKLSAYVY